jgi:hypothetical protein
MAEPRLRKPNGRKSEKAPVDHLITVTDESALPATKLSAPSAKQRWRRANLPKLK